MRKTVLTIGLFFICLWVFTFCNVSSWATPNDDIVPINAVLDLSRTEKQVDDQEKEVDKAWVLVDESSTKWATMLDENRRKTASNFLIEAMGTGFWALTGGLDGRLESEMRSYYANKSLMDLYSDELENVKSEIDLFNLMVPVYNSAHAYAEKTVNKHQASHHDAASPSNINHFVPDWEEKTCRDNLPSFSCRGNHTAGKTLCNVSYGTPREAFYTHREVCGEEVDAYGYKTLISGDGIAYYTCDTAANDRHRVRSCTRDFTNGSGVTNTCGDGFRRCVGPKKDHNWSDWINWETKHSDDDDDSTEETTQNEFQEPTSEPTPAPSYHMCGSHETWQSGDHSAAGCGYSGHYVCDGSDHSLQASCSDTNANGDYCTVTSFYAC